METKNKCKKCGEDLVKGDLFCGGCGSKPTVEETIAPQKIASSKPTQKPKTGKGSNKPLWIILGCLGFVLLSFIVMFFIFFIIAFINAAANC